MNKNILRRILHYTKPYRKWIVTTIISALIYVLTTLIIPIITGDAINSVVGPRQVDYKAVTIRILIIIVLFVIGAIAEWILSYASNELSYKTVKDMRKDAIDKILNVDLKHLDAMATGDIITNVITDVDQVSDGLIQCFKQFFTGIITIIGTLVLMFVICFPIAIAVVILTPLSLFVASYIAKSSAETFKLQSNKRGELGAFVNEYLSNQSIVTSYGLEQKTIDDFEKINQELDKYGFKSQIFGALINPSTRFVNAIIYAVLAVGGALIVLDGRFGLTIGALYSFLTYASHYTKPFNEISGVIAELQNSFASAKRIFAFLDIEDQSSDKNNYVLRDPQGNFNLDNVSFSYNDKKIVIDNLNLEIKKGTAVAIVGPTGCGKTTLINLLMRFYDVNQGIIKLDNHDIKTLTRNSLREGFGMVLQDSWIFKGSIRDNVAYSVDNATEEEIIAACKSSKVHNFVMRMEHGYDTIIDDASGLSEGQKQLICIARLMLKDPKILILDEATSSLDTRSEIIIQNNFKKLIKGKTSFIIAHRLATIKEADIILVMKNGQIVERGTHEALLSQKGFYFELYNAQFNGE